MEEGKKRKQEDVEEQVEEEIEDVDEDVVDVDFDFFDPKEIDYHAISGLLKQLLDADSILFDISSLADSILKTSGGTTIKVDGDDSDPFAIFSVLDLTPEQPIDVINTLIEYFISKTAKIPEFNRKLRKIFKSSSNSSKVGLIICERLINMPPQVIPPMYRLYLNNTENQTYDYYIILTKSFIEEESKLDQEDTPLIKKKKRSLLRVSNKNFFGDCRILITKYTLRFLG